MMKSLIFTGFFVLLFYVVNAQTGQTITGKITAGENDQPLAKATVQEKGTSNMHLQMRVEITPSPYNKTMQRW